MIREVQVGHHRTFECICGSLRHLFQLIGFQADNWVDLVRHNDLQVVRSLGLHSMLRLLVKRPPGTFYFPLLKLLVDVFAVLTDRV